MIRNYLKIAFRNLVKNKVYSTINILGLSVASAFCLLVYLQIQFEYSFDKFHQKSEQIHIIEMTDFTDIMLQKFGMNLGVKRNSTTMPHILAGDMKAALPEIKEVVRIKQTEETFRYADKTYNEKKGLFVDKNFLEVFSFDLKYGNKNQALNQRNGIIVSQQFANRYFGSENVIGKNINVSWGNPTICTITGVLDEIPSNSSMKFDFLIPIESSPDYQQNMSSGMNSFNTITAIEIDKNVSVDVFKKKLHHFGLKYFDQYLQNTPDVKPIDFVFTCSPLTKVSFLAVHPWFHSVNLSQLKNLSYIAALILIIACLNYVLLAVANSARRMQEVGIRKIVGANRRQIIAQFCLDTFLIAVIALGIALLLANLALPYYNSLIDSELQIQDISVWSIALGMIAIILIVCLLAGLYPAMLVSGKNPIAFLGNNKTFRVNPFFYKTLVVAQYTLCLIMLPCALVIYQQMKFLDQKDLGFDKEQIVVVNNTAWGNKAKTKLLTEKLHQYAQQNPNIIDMSGTSHTFGMYDINLDSLDNKPLQYAVYSVDYNYLPFLGVKFLNGRNFSAAFATDTLRNEAIIVNEKLFKALGKTAKVGAYNDFLKTKIIGVVKDFTSISVIDEQKPIVIRCNPSQIGKFYFRLRPNHIPETIQQLEKDWKQMADYQPFELSFLDDRIKEGYRDHLRWMRTINAATLLAIFVACLGLFGLSGINALNRTKEIGIRKVMGANISQILILLNKDTIRLTIISLLIAIPIGYYFMQKWLENFASRIDLNWKIFAVAGLVGIVTALLAVSYQSVKAALMNPVKSLKTD